MVLGMVSTLGATAPLENIANRVAQPLDYRAERWQARGILWRESALPRVQTCGKHSITGDGTVQVRANGRAVGYAGLATCGSVWACPVCNAKIQAVRRLEVGVAIAAHPAAAFGAYTLRHRRGQDLDTLWRALSKCWQAVARDLMVRRTRAALGHVGIIRAAECTHGDHGWHPHLHPVHLFDREVTSAEVQVLHAVEVRAWVAAAERLGLDAPLDRAQHLHLVTGDRAADALGDYFTKASYRPSTEAVGWEMTSTQTKSRTRAAGATPWDLLRRVYLDGDADALDLWHAWERGSKGKRALTWSRGLRARVGLDTEATDEEIAEAVVGSESDAGLVIEDWTPIRKNPALGGRLLSAIGPTMDWTAGRRFCDEHGINWRNA